VAPVIVPSTWATRACSRPMLVSELSACEADTIPRVIRVRPLSCTISARTGGSRPGSTPPAPIRHPRMVRLTSYRPFSIFEGVSAAAGGP
jgi:hypothetical protein